MRPQKPANSRIATARAVLALAEEKAKAADSVAASIKAARKASDHELETAEAAAVEASCALAMGEPSIKNAPSPAEIEALRLRRDGYVAATKIRELQAQQELDQVAKAMSELNAAVRAELLARRNDARARYQAVMTTHLLPVQAENMAIDHLLLTRFAVPGSTPRYSTFDEMFGPMAERVRHFATPSGPVPLDDDVRPDWFPRHGGSPHPGDLPATKMAIETIIASLGLEGLK